MVLSIWTESYFDGWVIIWGSFIEVMLHVQHLAYKGNCLETCQCRQHVQFQSPWGGSNQTLDSCQGIRILHVQLWIRTELVKLSSSIIQPGYNKAPLQTWEILTDCRILLETLTFVRFRNYRPLAQWRNDRPRWPRTAGGRRFEGAQNCSNMWDIFGKLNCSTSKNSRFTIDMHVFIRFFNVLLAI